MSANYDVIDNIENINFFNDNGYEKTKHVQQTQQKNASYEQLNDSSVRKFDFSQAYKFVEYNRDDVEKLHLLGSGKFSIVYEGTLKRSISVAIKEVRPTKQSTEIEQDALKLVNIEHKNIIKILGICHYDENFAPWIIMEIGAVSLRCFLDELDFDMNIKHKLDCLIQICQAMQFLHSKGIDNSDLKADNIVMSFRPKGPSEFKNVVYKLIDVSSKVGTTTHMPPEAFNGKYSHSKSDVWSFGVFCWEVLTGLKPYSEFNNRIVLMFEISNGNAHLSLEDIHHEKIVNLLESCWSFDIDNRPTFDSLSIELEAIQKDQKEFDYDESIEAESYSISMQVPNQLLFMDQDEMIDIEEDDDSDDETLTDSQYDIDIDSEDSEDENSLKRDYYQIPDASFFNFFN